MLLATLDNLVAKVKVEMEGEQGEKEGGKEGGSLH